MKYLLDTCVISEFSKPYPEKRLADWIKTVPPERLFVCAMTIGEIRKGHAKLPNSTKNAKIAEWINCILEDYQDRILPVDLTAAENWGETQGLSEVKGRTISTLDGLIASVARVHNLVLVTRNVSDFEDCQVSLFNPWILKQ